MAIKKQLEEAGKKIKDSVYQQMVNRFITTGQYDGMSDEQRIHMMQNPETAKLYQQYGHRKAQGGGVTAQEIQTLTDPNFYTPESYAEFDKDTVRQAIVDQTAFTNMHRNEGYWDVETNDPSWWSDAYLAEQLAGYDEQIWKEKTIEDLIASSTGYGWKYSNMSWDELLEEMMGDEELTSPYVEDWLRAYNLTVPADSRMTWEQLKGITDPVSRNAVYNDLQKRFASNIDTLLNSGMSRVTAPGQATASETLTYRKERALKEQENRQTTHELKALLNDPQYRNTMALASGSGPVTVEGETYSNLFMWATATGNGAMVMEYEEKGYGFMTPEELVTYQRLYEINQNDAARYLDALSRDLLYRRSLHRSTEKSLKATEGFFNGVLSWAEALATPIENILTGDILLQTYHTWKGDADPNAHYFDALNDQSYIRTAQSDEIAKKYGSVASFFYEGFNSIADVALTTGLDVAAGGTGLVNAGLNASKAYSGRLQSNAARDVQGLWSLGQAVGDAGIEALFERLGFDGSAKSGEAIWNFLKSAFGEGAEEFFSNAGTTAFDELLSYARGGDSELMEQYKAYVLAGEENPGMKVALSKAGEMAKDFAMGAIAGGALGGVTSAGKYLSTRSLGKTVANTADTDAVLNIAREMPVGSESRRLAKKYFPQALDGDVAAEETTESGKTKAKAKKPSLDGKETALDGEAVLDAPAKAKAKKPSLEGKETALDGEAVPDAPAESTSEVEKTEAKSEKKANKPKLSFYQLGKLTQALEVDLQEEHSRITNDVMDSAIANRLMELGDDAATARKNAPIVRKVYRGQEVTLTERTGIAWNKNASQVARELASTLQENEQVKKSQAEHAKSGAVGDVTTKSDESRVGKSWQTAMGVVADKATAHVRDMKTQLREALTNKKSALNEAISTAKSKAAKVARGSKNVTSKMVTISDGESGTESKGEFRRFKKHGGIMEMVVFTDGAEKTVSVEDMTQAEGSGMAEIIEYVADGGTHDMSEAEANTLAQVYQSVGGDADSVIRSYEMVYLSGYTGMEMPTNVLPDAAAKAVYDSAKTEAAADERNRVDRAMSVRRTRNGMVTFLGKVSKDNEVRGAGSEEALSEAMEGMTESQQRTVEVVRAFAHKFQINMVLFESTDEGISTMQNGSYDPNTHTVYIDINSGANSTADIKEAKERGTLGYAMMRTLGHEVTHAIESTSAEGYAAYKAAVKGKLGKQWSSLVQEKLVNALDRGRKLTLQGAEAEVVADASEYILQDSKFVDEIDKTVRGKVKAVIADFVQKVRSIFSALTGGHWESEALRRMQGNVYHYLDNLQQLWDVAAEEMVGKSEETVFDETEHYDVPDESAMPKLQTSGRKILPKQPVAFSSRDDQVDTPQFRAWFGDSKVVDASGQPKVMYHGTRADKDFTVFNTYGSNFGLFGVGSYFTDDKTVAEGYTRKGKGSNPRVYEVYLSIENPLDMDAAYDPAIWQTDDEYLNRQFEGAKTNEDAFRILKEFCANEDMLRSEAEEFITDLIMSKGFDGVKHTGGGRYNKGDTNRHEVYIAFEPEQIKSATDNVGTFDRTNPDIRYSARDTAERRGLTPEQRKATLPALDEDAVFADDVTRTVQFSPREEAEKNKTTIKQQIKAVASKLNNMAVVSSINAPNMSKWPDKKKKAWVLDVLKNSGYKIDVQGFGVVEVGKNQIETSLTYLNEAGELAAFACIPRVLKRGARVSGHENHKGRWYETVTFAAPVEINGVRGNMAVVVKRFDRYLYKTHRILMPDGAAFEFVEQQKTEVGLLDGIPPVEAQAQDANSVNSSVPQSDKLVNRKIQYSQRDLPTDAISIREYLGSMTQTSRMTDTERSLLGRYQAHLKTLGEKEAAIAEQEEIIRTAPLRNEDGTINEELQKAKNRIRVLREQAARESRALAAAETSTGFARLMATSRQMVDTYLLGASGSVADAADALDEEVATLTERLKGLAEDITRTAVGQRTAFARGLYDQKQLNAAAKSLKDAYGSRMSVQGIADRLALCFGELYEDGSADGVKRFVDDVRELATDILQGHKYRYKSEVLPLLREKLGTISLTEIDLMEIKNAGLTLAEYKRMLSPYVTVAAGGSDLSSAIDGTMSYGDGTLAAILGEDVEGNLAMRLYEVISNEKAREAEIGTEGMTEGEMITAVMADIAGATLPVAEDSRTIDYLRKELKKHAGASVEASQLVDEAIAGARKVTERAGRVWAEAARNAQTAKAAVEYYRKLEEQRRVTELREQKQAITEQLRSEYAKRLEEKVKKQRAEYREREQNAREYRNSREELNKLRRTIGRKVKRLNALRVRETDAKHVPQELQHIADVVMQTFTDSSLGRLAFSSENMASLSRRYHLLIEQENDMSYCWDPEIEEQIELLQTMGEAYTAIRERGAGIPSYFSVEGVEMEMEMLNGVDNIVSNVLHMIDAWNDAFISGRTETFNVYAAMTGKELLDKKDFRQLRGGLGTLQKAVDELLRTGNMTPVYYMEHLNSPLLKEVFDAVREGQSRYARIVAEGKAFVQEAKVRYHYGAWVADAKLQMKTSQGHQIELTREEAIELYAIAKRERTNKLYLTEHLINGGFQFKDVLKKKGAGLQAAEKTTHQLDAADIARIENWLTAEQKAYADALVGFLSTTMAEYGNEAAMAMFGYKKFNEAYYIPFHTAAEQRYQRGDEGPGGEDAGTGRVKNSGFTKKLTYKANATLVVGGLTDTVSEHIHKMATYAALVEPIENMKRLLNYKMVDKDGTTNTIRALIGKKYGQASQDYMTQLLKDLNGAAQGDERATKGVNWLISAFKRGAVMASASVVLQQPTAIARAMADIPVKYFGQNPFYRPGKGTWDEMMKYSGTAVIKDMGKFDVGMGLTASQYIADEHLNAVEAYRRLRAEGRWEAGKAGYKRFMEWLTAAPGKADQWTWGLIWKANKARQADLHPDMDHNSDAFLELCGRTFDDVIDHTQVYDSVLTRSNLMRSKNGFHQMATSFMAEPTMSINMLYDAVMGKHRPGKRAAIIGGVMASQVLAGAMAALVQAWNDDEDERNWLEKYADRATGNILGNINIFSMIPYISDLVSLLEGYDVERADMTVLSTIITYTGSFFEKVGKGESLTWKDWENFAGNWANLTGVPAKNIMREIRRTLNAVTKTDWSAPNMSNVGLAMSENLIWNSGRNTEYYERIVAADLRGDEQAAEDYREYMLTSKMVSEDDLKSGLKKAMKERVIAGDADKQTAIEYLVKIGAYDEADDAYWEVDKWEYVQETGNGADTYRKYDDFAAAVRTGESLKQVIQTYLDNGVSKETLADQITTAFRKEYVDLYNSGKRSEASVLQSRILTAYVALGYDRNRKLKDVQKWLEDKD